MFIISETELTKAQTEEIRIFEQLCNSYDNTNSTLFLSNNFNFDKTMKSFFLMYENAVLVSVMVLFIPTKKEAEIYALTLPEYRKKGCFTQLLKLAKDELKLFNLNNILFVHNPKTTHAKHILNKLCATYEFSEYTMHYDGGKIDYQADFLSLVHVENEIDKETIVKTFTSAFPSENPEDSAHWFECNFSSPTNKIYKAVANEKIVGTLCVGYEQEPVSVFGLCIHKDEQGKGYGKAMLLSILSELTAKNHAIHLDVNSSNDIAFAMYQKYGFKITAQNDYYRHIF